MKKLGLVLLVVLVSLGFSSSASAGVASIAKEGILFTGGFFAGLAGHEVGHWTIAKIYKINTDIDIDITEVSGYCYYHSKFEGTPQRNFALGGFASEIVSSNIMLYSPTIPKDNSFVIGYLTFNIISPLSYIYHHEFGGEGEHGDLKNIDDNDQNRSLKVEHVEIAIATHALFTAYRLWKNEDFQKSPIHSYGAVAKGYFCHAELVSASRFYLYFQGILKRVQDDNRV